MHSPGISGLWVSGPACNQFFLVKKPEANLIRRYKRELQLPRVPNSKWKTSSKSNVAFYSLFTVIDPSWLFLLKWFWFWIDCYSQVRIFKIFKFINRFSKWSVLHGGGADRWNASRSGSHWLVWDQFDTWQWKHGVLSSVWFNVGELRDRATNGRWLDLLWSWSRARCADHERTTRYRDYQKLSQGKFMPTGKISGWFYSFLNLPVRLVQTNSEYTNYR